MLQCTHHASTSFDLGFTTAQFAVQLPCVQLKLGLSHWQLFFFFQNKRLIDPYQESLVCRISLRRRSQCFNKINIIKVFHKTCCYFILNSPTRQDATIINMTFGKNKVSKQYYFTVYCQISAPKLRRYYEVRC